MAFLLNSTRNYANFTTYTNKKEQKSIYLKKKR